jgi:ABC-type lipoprotein export system ATPase subunit
VYRRPCSGPLPVLTAAENIGVPLRPPRTERRAREDRIALVLGLLGLLGLEDHAARRPGELSGGQQRGVAIARAGAAGTRGRRAHLRALHAVKRSKDPTCTR